MADHDNMARARKWRELVALQLRAEGFRDARPLPIPRGPISSRVGSYEGPQPHVTGMPEGVFVETRVDYRERFGASLDLAEQSGTLVGARHVGVVQLRRRADAASGYVVMSVEGWAALVREAYGIEVSA